MADGAYNGAERVSDQSSFKFSIASATSDGSTAVTDYSALPDGYWTGDVKVQFNATDHACVMNEKFGRFFSRIS